jgi:hypothetical protein
VESTMSDQTQPAPPVSSAEYLKLLREKRNQRRNAGTEEAPPQTTPKQATKDQEKDDDLFPGIPKPREKKTIVSWRAPSRPFKKRDRHYYTTVAAIVFLISLILFFAGQFLPIAVVISVGFLAYVLSSVPPHNVKIEITTYGIEIEDLLYYWEEMGRFWLEEKYDQELLTIEVMRFPGRIILMFEEGKKEELREILSEVLLEEKPAETFYDKAAKWLQDKIPLEINS